MAVVDIYLYGSAPSPTDIILRNPLVPIVVVIVGGVGGIGGRHRPPDRPPILVRWCPTHEAGVCRRVLGADGRYYCVPIIEARSLWENLVDQYGRAEATKVYIGMRVSRQGPFAEGNKYDPERPAAVRRRERLSRAKRL